MSSCSVPRLGWEAADQWVWLTSARHPPGWPAGGGRQWSGGGEKNLDGWYREIATSVSCRSDVSLERPANQLKERNHESNNTSRVLLCYLYEGSTSFFLLFFLSGALDKDPHIHTDADGKSWDLIPSTKHNAELRSMKNGSNAASFTNAALLPNPLVHTFRPRSCPVLPSHNQRIPARSVPPVGG